MKASVKSKQVLFSIPLLDPAVCNFNTHIYIIISVYVINYKGCIKGFWDQIQVNEF